MMAGFPIQQLFRSSYQRFLQTGFPLSDVQRKAASSILRCKSEASGFNITVCEDCGHIALHYNSCRDRHCPNCQAIPREIWVDKRRAEVIDSPYFHVVFTLPHELNPLLYANQALLYGLFHKCCAQTLLELSQNPRFLGATPGIIQVLHTWDQGLGYHVHIHCIVSGGGLTASRKLRVCGKHFFIPVHVLRDKFKGKFLSCLDSLFRQGSLLFPSSLDSLRPPSGWRHFKDRLYKKDWCPYIKETFNGFGNAIAYLGKYTHKVAISNSRILSLTEAEVSFSARGRKPGEPRRVITLSHEEFIRRFLTHVLPRGFQKIRYYGFLNNRGKSRNLKLIFTLQGRQRFQARFTGMAVGEILPALWGIDIRVCPVCGGIHTRLAGRVYARDR